MVYLIGGAPRCGKTILSKKLAAKKKISWISTDSIWSVVSSYTPKDQIGKKFPYRKTRLGLHDPKSLLRAEITESKTLWPGIKAFIKKLIDSREDCVIEGVHLMPALVNGLKRTKYWNNIKILYLVKEDPRKIKSGFSRNAAAHDWLSPLLKNPQIREAAAEMVREKSRYISAEARKYGFKVVVMDDDFEKKIVALSRF
jgi:2-phosphoglycerate kinase